MGHTVFLQIPVVIRLGAHTRCRVVWKYDISLCSAAVPPGQSHPNTAACLQEFHGKGTQASGDRRVHAAGRRRRQLARACRLNV
jgi:hypothetical protein